MQEAPYMYANGSGYLSQVMSRVGDAFRAKHGDDIAFDIIPVRTWQQLVARARTSRWVSYTHHSSQLDRLLFKVFQLQNRKG